MNRLLCAVPDMQVNPGRVRRASVGGSCMTI
jgi:hypothetical protein